MSDIFVSYASEDRERVTVVAKTLESAGYSVWWDRQIPIGFKFADYIELKLNEARCVVVVWSAKSIESDWVALEADVAKDRGVLVPALIDDVSPPWEYRKILAAKLVDWGDDPSHPEWKRLIEAVERHFKGRHEQPHSGQSKVAPPPDEAKTGTDSGTATGERKDVAVEHLPLTGGAVILVDQAKEMKRAKHSHLGLNHWLVVLLQRHSGVAERLTGDVDLKAVLGEAHRCLRDGDPGEEVSVDGLLGRADEVARRRGKDQIWERDLALVLMETAGLT